MGQPIIANRTHRVVRYVSNGPLTNGPTDSCQPIVINSCVHTRWAVHHNSTGLHLTCTTLLLLIAAPEMLLLLLIAQKPGLTELTTVHAHTCCCAQLQHRPAPPCTPQLRLTAAPGSDWCTLARPARALCNAINRHADQKTSTSLHLSCIALLLLPAAPGSSAAVLLSTACTFQVCQASQQCQATRMQRITPAQPAPQLHTVC